MLAQHVFERSEEPVRLVPAVGHRAAESRVGSLPHQQPARVLLTVEPVQRRNDAEPRQVEPEMVGRVILERMRLVEQHDAVIRQQRAGRPAGRPHGEVGEEKRVVRHHNVGRLPRLPRPVVEAVAVEFTFRPEAAGAVAAGERPGLGLKPEIDRIAFAVGGGTPSIARGGRCRAQAPERAAARRAVRRRATRTGGGTDSCAVPWRARP